LITVVSVNSLSAQLIAIKEMFVNDNI